MSIRRLIGVGCWMWIGLLSVSCSSMPSIDQQKQLVRSGDFRIQQLTPMAFVETWGDPRTRTSSSHTFSACRTAD